MELIQPSTTLDQGHQMRKQKIEIKNKIKKKHTRSQPIQAGDHKSARNRQDGIIKTNMKHK